MTVKILVWTMDLAVARVQTSGPRSFGHEASERNYGSRHHDILLWDSKSSETMYANTKSASDAETMDLPFATPHIGLRLEQCRQSCSPLAILFHRGRPKPFHHVSLVNCRPFIWRGPRVTSWHHDCLCRSRAKTTLSSDARSALASARVSAAGTALRMPRRQPALPCVQLLTANHI